MEEERGTSTPKEFHLVRGDLTNIGRLQDLFERVFISPSTTRRDPSSFSLDTMARHRTVYVLLSILGLFLLGTVVVLSSVSYYLAIDKAAYLTELEVPSLGNTTRWNATEHGKVERIPRILHQTWKSETLPSRWKGISQACRDMMPD